MPSAVGVALSRVLGPLNGDADLAKYAVLAFLSCILIGILDAAFSKRYKIDAKVRRLFLFGFGGACTTIPRVAIRLMSLPGTAASHVLPIAGALAIGVICLVVGEFAGKLF